MANNGLMPCNSVQEAWTKQGSRWHPSPHQEPPAPLGDHLLAGEEYDFNIGEIKTFLQKDGAKLT